MVSPWGKGFGGSLPVTCRKSICFILRKTICLIPCRKSGDSASTRRLLNQKRLTSWSVEYVHVLTSNAVDSPLRDLGESTEQPTVL